MRPMFTWRDGGSAAPFGGSGWRLGVGSLVVLLVVGCGVQSYSSKVRSQGPSTAAAEPAPAVPMATTPAPPVAEAPAAQPAPELTESQRAALVTARKALPASALGFSFGESVEAFKTACKKLGGWPADRAEDHVSCRGPNPPEFKAEAVDARFCAGELCELTGVPADKTPQRATRIHAVTEQEYGAWIATSPEVECAANGSDTFAHHWLWFDPSAPSEARIVGSVAVRFVCQKAGERPSPSLVIRDAAGHRAHGSLTADDLK